MKKIILILLLIVLFLGGMLYIFVSNKNKKEVVVSSEPAIEEQRTTYVEEYIDLVRNKDGVPFGLETVEERESNMFIEKLAEVKLHPEHILKVGNEIYFVSKVTKDDEGEGQALFIYDFLLRKFGELYFRKNEELGDDVLLSLVAIDVENNKLVIALKKGTSDCDSLWLFQRDNFYTFDLLGNEKKDLLRYRIPEWKIREEKDTFPDCNMNT